MLSQVQEVEGAQPFAIRIQQRTAPNSGSKLLNADSSLQEAAVMIPVICGIQSKVLRSRLLRGSCVFRHLRLYSLSCPPPQVFL